MQPSEPKAQKVPNDLNAPSDAEKRAQAAENRLKQQSQQQLAAQPLKPDQGSAPAAQQAQRAGSSNAKQAQQAVLSQAAASQASTKTVSVFESTFCHSRVCVFLVQGS